MVRVRGGDMVVGERGCRDKRPVGTYLVEGGSRGGRW